ncbi:beta-lactamase [Tenacibaculum holothuriorum]|uniref:Beta-lactamase n=1 Tax=Tenacibaculum holothuriorum TaxID=1635173 RepID=A0A1Y2PFJ3_9FLAO|nr:serine hydrolase [Tenacibaculum holothuriorum]OSY89266.1 beta-lactamase [Tenacibaculum holothuriorum]
MKYIKPLHLALVILFISCGTSKKVTPVLFSKNDIKTSSKKEVYIENFTLNKDEYLTANFILKKPLIESLKELSEKDLPKEELLKKGNFQFSFFVDDQLIHTENLNIGAGTPDSKVQELKYKVPLIYPKMLDHWGWFTWLKFMKMSGGRDAFNDNKHKLTVEVRSYLNDASLKVGKLLAKGNIDIKVEELPYDKNLISIQNIKPIKDFKISKELYNKQKIEALNKKIAQGRFEHINGIVILKNGELLLEEYFNESKRESLHDPRSVGKTIASTITGIAIDEEHIKNENVKLNEFYDLKRYKNHSQKKENVTLKSLLTMSSGFVGDDNDYSSIGNENRMYPTDNWVKFALDLPMDTNKKVGEKYSYFTAGVVVLGDILQKTVPGGLENYADKKLFKPLNINNYKWEYTPQNVANTAGGIRLRAIDFAKYGQLYKNNGKWEGKQLLSSEWVKKSLIKHVKQPNKDNAYYGFLFWNKTYTINGKSYETYFCTGNGGNKIFIFKDIPFVIVITASGYNLPYMHTDVDKMMIDYILPAILK